jgi:phosphate transport system protein
VFRELIEAMRRRPLLDQMMCEMEQMVSQAVNMYRPLVEVLTGPTKLTQEAKDAIYATDIEINRLQRNIRKQLVEHLVAATGTDVPVCLVLMSVSKDAERVGDMCKNILEVAEAMGGPLRNDRYGERFRKLLAETEALFEPTVEAFRTSDKDLGRKAVESGRALAKECDHVIDDLIEDSLPCREAVLYTLLARHVKRIDSHLSNIATSVVMPFHRLDYFDEKWEKPPRS